MATVKTSVIQIDTKPATSSVKDLRKELKELRDQLLNLEKGTDEYAQTMQKAANIQHELRDQTAELNASAMDFGQVASNMTKSVNGMIGGLQSVSALMGMFGVESEDAQKAILKLQQSMALIQGLTSFESGLKATNRLLLRYSNSSKVAAQATKLFQLALSPKIFIPVTVAIGALAIAFDKLTGKSRELAKAEKERAEAYKASQMEEKVRKEKEYADQLDREVNLVKRIAEAQGKNSVQVNEALRNLYQTRLDSVQAQLKNRYRDDEKLTLKAEMRDLNDELKKLDETSEEYIPTLLKLTSKEMELKKITPLTADEVSNLEAEENKLKNTIKDLNREIEDGKLIENIEGQAKAAKNAAAAYESLVDKYRDTVEKFQLEMKKELELAENNEALRLNIIEKYGQKIFEAREAEIKDTRKHAYDADLKNLNDLYDKKEISSAEYYDRLRKLDAKYMLDWGSYQAAAIARYNKDLIDIRQQFLNWQISYQQYTVKIDESTRNYYDELKKSSEEHISLREEEIAALYEYRHLLNNTNGEEVSYITDLLSTMESVGTEIRRLYPEILSYSVEEQQKLITNVINSMIDSNNASINAARTTIYQIQDYYIKARESAQNWLEALNTLEARKFEDRRAQIQKEYESELDMMQKLLDQQLITKEDYYAAAETADKKYCNNYKQLVWDTYSEQVQILAEVGSATSSIGNAIQANAEYQLEAGKISEEEYKESVKRAQAYNIAGVVISTLAGIANATASIWSPNNAYLTVWGQAGMQAAITTEMLASMAAQIAQIKKQNYGTLNGTSVSAAATGSLIAPVQYTNSVQGASEMGIRDTRVYVTEHDITDTQRRVQVAQSEARF